MKKLIQRQAMLRIAGIIVLVAVIGFSIVACDNGGGPPSGPPGGGPGDTNKATYTGTAEGANYTLEITKGGGSPPVTPPGGNSALNGTWVNSTEGEKLVLNNGSFTMSQYDVELVRGTYSPSGSNMNMTPTQVSGAAAGDNASTLGLSTSQWYTKEQMRAVIIQTLRSYYGFSQSEAEATYNNTPQLSGSVNELFATQTAPYTLNGNTLTVTAWRGDSTFTRTGGPSPSILYADSARAITPSVGDNYVLTVTENGTTKTSNGTVTSTTGTLTLQPSNTTVTFDITVTTTGDITHINGTITYTDNTTKQVDNVTFSFEQGIGWPPASILAKHGISGMSAPAGARDIEWITVDYSQGYDGRGIIIYFTGSQANDNPIKNWFTSHGWTSFYNVNDDDGVSSMFFKSDYTSSAIYHRDFDDDRHNCFILVTHTDY